MLKLERQAYSCLSQSCLNASVIDGAPIGGIVAVPLINCRMSESLNLAFCNQNFKWYITAFSKLLWPLLLFLEKPAISWVNGINIGKNIIHFAVKLYLKKRMVVQFFFFLSFENNAMIYKSLPYMAT